jgi:hypothetical protein
MNMRKKERKKKKKKGKERRKERKDGDAPKAIPSPGA